jgi:hypothetical protein
MEVMLRRLIRRRQVAADAHLTSRRAERLAVGLVTIGTDDATCIHPALNERAVLEDFVFDLSVDMIELIVEQGDAMRVAEWTTMDVVIAELFAS